MLKHVIDHVLKKYKHTLRGNALEIGSDRGPLVPEDGFTYYFNNFFKEMDKTFYSVDVEPGAHGRARYIIGENAYLMTGEKFAIEIVPTLNTKFSFVCLDNFDFVIPGWEHYDEVKKTYDSLGMELNNENSQKAHLDQIVALYHFIESDAIVVFDDTWQKPDGTFGGKGGTAVPWLMKREFNVVAQGPIGEIVAGSYVILIRNSELRLDPTDCSKLSNLDNSILHIQARNILETQCYYDGHEAIKEWQRVLAPNGRLVIETPDFLRIASRFVNSDESGRIALYPELFGSPWSVGKRIGFMYTENQLIWTMNALGFRNVKRRPAGELVLVVEGHKQ